MCWEDLEIVDGFVDLRLAVAKAGVAEMFFRWYPYGRSVVGVQSMIGRRSFGRLLTLDLGRDEFYSGQ